MDRTARYAKALTAVLVVLALFMGWATGQLMARDEAVEAFLSWRRCMEPAWETREEYPAAVVEACVGKAWGDYWDGRVR
jgi:hypothetical protein